MQNTYTSLHCPYMSTANMVPVLLSISGPGVTKRPYRAEKILHPPTTAPDQWSGTTQQNHNLQSKDTKNPHPTPSKYIELCRAKISSPTISDITSAPPLIFCQIFGSRVITPLYILHYCCSNSLRTVFFQKNRTVITDHVITQFSGLDAASRGCCSRIGKNEKQKNWNKWEKLHNIFCCLQNSKNREKEQRGQTEFLHYLYPTSLLEEADLLFLQVLAFIGSRLRFFPLSTIQFSLQSHLYCNL